MARKHPDALPVEQSRAQGVPLRAIRKLARQIAQEFRPHRIILFGPYAYGTPRADSDVDLLVIMPTGNMIGQCVKIRRATEHRFPLDLIVRTPEYVRRRIEAGDWFIREIVSNGKVLHSARANRWRCASQFRSGRVQSVVVPGDFRMTDDPEMLVGLSTGELEALSESLLAPSAQARLDDLLARNADHRLEAAEVSELDRLLERVDQLTVLKTRARYTLQHHQAGASRA